MKEGKADIITPRSGKVKDDRECSNRGEDYEQFVQTNRRIYQGVVGTGERRRIRNTEKYFVRIFSLCAISD